MPKVAFFKKKQQKNKKTIDFVAFVFERATYYLDATTWQIKERIFYLYSIFKANHTASSKRLFHLPSG